MKFDKQSFNPFEFVTYDGYFPHSRALHTKFTEKVIDAFDVFYRLFDYPTFGILFLITGLKDYCNKTLKASLHDKTAKFNLILMSVEDGQQIDVNRLQQVSAQNKNKSILINQNNQISIYGLTENGWGVTKLYNGHRVFNIIAFPDVPEISMLNKNDLPEHTFQEIVSNKAHLTRGFKWFLFGCLKPLAAVFYGATFALEVVGDYILRPIFATILLLPSLPFVAVAHLITKIISAYKKNQAEKIEVIPEGSTTAITLKQFLKDHSSSIEYLKIQKIKKKPVKTKSGEKMQAKIKFRINDTPRDAQDFYAHSIFSPINDSRLMSLAQKNVYVSNTLNETHYFKK